ncbi:bifunctional DNA primase/polymerase [Nitrosovibrio sp. Nv4]|uniref:bifunctional DNA primase/polymerase n=2 Tax=Nitrosovibrio sp. Nv4 TaxID=1945880 RepID=UPI000BD0FDBF|nr:bifunctional DNA primase/polymerase [Nitrosovibrio sp. Nv4]SOD41367.1 Bifunctional DNA primase/polymerase, N-terminal [Nitrosovibrio sp. Nv4]
MKSIDYAVKLAKMGFHIFPLLSDRKTPPKGMHFKESATRSVTALVGWFDNTDANIGIFTEKFGDDKALIVVDVDVKDGKNGEQTLLKLELEGFELPETLAQRTANGGRHLIFASDAPVRPGANVLGKGLDIRSGGSYIVGAGSVIGSGAYTIDDTPIADAPDWLIERCRAVKEKSTVEASIVEGVDHDRAATRVIKYLETEAPLSIEGQGGDETAYRVAARCKDLGINESGCAQLMYDHWNERCSPPWAYVALLVKVRNAYEYGHEPQGIAAPEAEFKPVPTPPGAPQLKDPIEALNDRYAFVLAGGGAQVLWETTDANGKYKLDHLSLGAFHADFANKKMVVGKKEQSISQLWLESKGRRSYAGIVFMPGQQAPDRFYNLWKGFQYEPAERYTNHPAVEQFIEHARDNVCRGDVVLFKWLIGYFAHLVQRPWEKPLVALVFRGGKGVGKNALVERVGTLLGGHFLLTSNRRYLIGNFNGHLENCLLFTLDEAFWSGDKQAEGIIKDLITGREHIIEHKGEKPYSVDNRTRVCIIGNEEWLVPATHDERRFAVFDVGDGRKQDREYFQSMREGMEKDGYPHLLRYLMDFDLTGIDINLAPVTNALLDQKNESLDPLHQWWLDCLEEERIVGSEFGGWPEDIECERFRAAFKRYVKDRNVRSRVPEDRAIGRLIKQCAPGITKSRARRGDELPYVYHVPRVEISRTDWEKFIGHKVRWEQ